MPGVQYRPACCHRTPVTGTAGAWTPPDSPISPGILEYCWATELIEGSAAGKLIENETVSRLQAVLYLRTTAAALLTTICGQDGDLVALRDLRCVFIAIGHGGSMLIWPPSYVLAYRYPRAASSLNLPSWPQTALRH